MTVDSAEAQVASPTRSGPRTGRRQVDRAGNVSVSSRDESACRPGDAVRGFVGTGAAAVILARLPAPGAVWTSALVVPACVLALCLATVRSREGIILGIGTMVVVHLLVDALFPGR